MAEVNPNTAMLLDRESLVRDAKATEDYSDQVDKLFENVALIQLEEPGGIEEATESILELEKKARQASDGLSVSRLCCKLLELHKNASRWEAVNDWVVTLSKKRGQLKRAIVDMVQLGMCWVTELTDKELKLQLIRALGSVSDGKIFLEVEKARLVLLEAQMFESEGKTDEAALLLQEVQVETFGAMERREKSLYILDQMRLVLLRKDYIRCQIISKKINTKLLEAEDLQDVKLKYYGYLIELHTHEKDYLNIANDHWQCFNTPQVKEGDEWQAYLSNYVIYLTMAPRSEKTLTPIQNLRDTELKRLAALPVIRRLVSDYLSTELVDWPLPYEADLLSLNVFSLADGEENWKQFRIRFMQHNILVLSKYYSRIYIAGAAQLLGISVDETEERISQLVYSDSIHAWIDRPAGIVTFGKPKTYSEKLDSWAADISTLLNLVEETTHLINNDRMVHAAIQKRRQLREKA